MGAIIRSFANAGAIIAGAARRMGQSRSVYVFSALPGSMASG